MGSLIVCVLGSCVLKYDQVSLIGDKIDVVEDDLYDSFINGEGKALVLNDSDFTELSNFKTAVSENKEYTLKEIFANLKATNESIWEEGKEIDKVEHRFIDCGNDGVKELLVKFDLPIGDDAKMQMILNDRNDRLNICYVVDSWARSETIISKNGFIDSSGSGGAYSHFERKGIVDEFGTYKEWYSCSYDSDEATISYYATIDGDVLTLDFSELNTENFVIAHYVINDEDYFSYYFIDESNEGMYDPENPYYKVFSENNIKNVYSEDEISSILNNRKNEIGLKDI